MAVTVPPEPAKLAPTVVAAARFPLADTDAVTVPTEAVAVLARARQGDSDAFRALVEQHSHAVFRLAYRMTGNEQDAEDVVQEALARALQTWPFYGVPKNPSAWIMRASQNLALDVVPKLGIELVLERAAAQPAVPAGHCDPPVVLRIRPIASVSRSQRAASSFSCFRPLAVRR